MRVQLVLHNERRRRHVAAGVLGGPLAYDNARLAAQESNHSHPIVQYLQAARTTRATQIADVPNRFHADWLARGLDSYYRSVGVPHHLSLPLPGPVGSQQAFVLGRADRFTDREMAAARAVQMLLAGLDRQATALRQAAPDVAAIIDFGLTPREIAVLGLLAEGLTAAAIGRRLLISRGTVIKHLQNLYPKLGVSDRLSAVRVSDRHGVLRSRNTNM